MPSSGRRNDDTRCEEHDSKRCCGESMILLARADRGKQVILKWIASRYRNATITISLRTVLLYLYYSKICKFCTPEYLYTMHTALLLDTIHHKWHPTARYVALHSQFRKLPIFNKPKLSNKQGMQSLYATLMPAVQIKNTQSKPLRESLNLYDGPQKEHEVQSH